MASVIGKRLSLHRRVAREQNENAALKSENLQLQPLASLGSVLCMIAHEINNLLTPLASYAALAQKNRDDAALTEKVLERTIHNCRHASRMMESMLALANGGKQQKEIAPLGPLLEEVFACLCRDFRKDGISVETAIAEGLSIWAVPVQLQQVLMNLVINARDAMLQRGGVLKVAATEDAESTCIRVSDTGCGMDAGSLVRIFETFYSTKTGSKSEATHSGSGVGLAFCKRVVEMHGGQLSVQSRPSHGTTFTIHLPKAQPGGT